MIKEYIDYKLRRVEEIMASPLISDAEKEKAGA